jgi:hypothetical protein
MAKSTYWCRFGCPPAADYLAPFEKDVRKVTVLYEPYCLWGVPDFVPEDAVSEIADLLGVRDSSAWNA